MNMPLVRTLKIVMYSCALTMGALVAFSFLSPVILLADSVSHFRLHLTIPLIFASLGILFFRHWTRGMILLIIGIISLITVDLFGGATSNVSAKEDEKGLTVIQLNLYYWNQSKEKVQELVKAEKADVVILQEVSRHTKTILTNLEEEYPHRVLCPYSTEGAVAVLSRFPKVEENATGCAVRMGLAWIRVMAHGRPVSVASLHLDWPYPFDQNQQIDSLQKHLESIPQPTVIGGDFNAAPWSSAVHKIARATNTKVIGGVRFTLKKRLFKGLIPLDLPVDHILKSPTLTAHRIEVGDYVGSDHLPVISRISFHKPL